MPFTSTEIANAGLSALDFYLKNNPVDQVATERPLLKKLMEAKKNFPGAKQYIIEQVRYTYNSNFQWFIGDAEVTYNHRQTLKQASYPWRGCHDGFALNEDELLQNGIAIDDNQKPGNSSEAERVQITNIFEENTESLRLGFEQKFDFELHRDGSQSGDALAGLDYLISLTPTVGTVGGIDRSANAFWQNNVKTGLAGGNTTMIDGMEQAWRACSRNGGQPDFILAGETFIDGFRDASQASITRFSDPASKGYKLDPSVTNLSFHGVPIIWDPVFLDLDTQLAPPTPWQKRCYFINTKFMKLRPAAGHDMKTRKPPRVYNRYTYYWGLTWKGAITLGRSNAMAVLTVA